MWQNVYLQTIRYFQSLGDLEALVKSQSLEKQWTEPLEGGGGGLENLNSNPTSAK